MVTSPEPLTNEFIVIQEGMAFGNSQHLSSFGGGAEQNSIGVAGCQRFGAGMDERLEFSAKAHFSGPLVGAVVPLNAVHRFGQKGPASSYRCE